MSNNEIAEKSLEDACAIILNKQHELVNDLSENGRKGFYILVSAGGYLVEEAIKENVRKQREGIK